MEIKSFRLQRKPEDHSLLERFPFWIGTLAGSLFILVVFLVAYAEIRGEVRRHDSLLDFLSSGAMMQKRMQAKTPSGLIAPQLALVSPLPGSSVAGVTRVTLSLGRSTNMVIVKLFLDGTEKSMIAAPYVFDWNTAEVKNGSHTLKFTATDEKGNESSVSAEVTVQN